MEDIWQYNALCNVAVIFDERFEKMFLVTRSIFEHARANCISQKSSNLSLMVRISCISWKPSSS